MKLPLVSLTLLGYYYKLVFTPTLPSTFKKVDGELETIFFFLKLSGNSRIEKYNSLKKPQLYR